MISVQIIQLGINCLWHFKDATLWYIKYRLQNIAVYTADSHDTHDSNQIHVQTG